MIYVINSLSDPLIKLVNDDPVRPNIPVEFRVSNDNEIFVLLDSDNLPEAVVCIAYKDYIPVDEAQLMYASEIPSTAVFYTIWSYKPGAGRKLIRESKKHIEMNKPGIVKFVTLSPRTEMARIFHLKNGASIFRENETSINYEYH
jgi:hypothetical protein